MTDDQRKADIIRIAREGQKIIDEKQASLPSQEGKPAIEIKPISAGVMGLEAFINAAFPPRPSYLGGWLKSQTITLVSGARGCGKSWFALGVLLSVCQGQDFGPWPIGDIKTPCDILYLDAEMVETDVQERLMMLNCSGLKSNFHIYSDAFANSVGVGRARLDKQAWRDDFAKFLSEKNIKLVCLDNIASLTGGIDENARADWAEVNDWLIRLKFAGISTILLHHTGKSGSQRGTSAREDNVDTSILLEKPKNHSADDGCNFVCKFTKSRVSQRFLNQVRPTEFTLMPDESGAKMIWTFKKQGSREQILEMSESGMDSKDIAKELDVKATYVYRVLRDKGKNS